MSIKILLVEDDDLIGSGPGLSIVDRIAHYFNGTVQFETGLDGRGLAVIVEFPTTEHDLDETQGASIHDGEYAHGEKLPPYLLLWETSFRDGSQRINKTDKPLFL
ncbi:MAG: hypothetical protein EPN70_13370 [Paraburkholderia sp.]|uniref:hypothetical protein n=1 Tax=Paraburkholderia sp. TaxID=1926495 RepID=UPI0011FF93BF|nr:hypothetical protein [Paraburkholderia sp.]TAM03713.1 MAG: hypothetical protein EPN70_13370 [Paraburkholderia sp.]